MIEELKKYIIRLFIKNGRQVISKHNKKAQ